MTSLFNFTRNTPVSGQVIRAQHIDNIENFVSQLIGFILPDSTAITGITTINIGANLMASGNAANGITLWSTASGSVSGGGTGALCFPAIYSYLFDGMTEEQCFSTNYIMSGFFAKLGTAPSSNQTIATYKNNNYLGNITINSSALTGALTSSQNLVFGDVLKFVVSGAPNAVDTAAGYPIFLGVY